MKTRTVTIILFSILLFGSSCKKKPPTVQGRWKPVAVDAAYIKSFGLSNDQVKEMLDKSLIGFQKGGTFFSFQTHDTVRGIFTYDERQGKLSTIPAGQGTQTFDIKFLEPDEITLTNDFGKMTLKRL